MNETVTTERARELLDSLFVSEHADIRDQIAEALEGRDRIEKLTGVLECANATARRRAEHIAELTASLAAAQKEVEELRAGKATGEKK